jgi:hypothetical protein
LFEAFGAADGTGWVDARDRRDRAGVDFGENARALGAVGGQEDVVDRMRLGRIGGVLQP